MNIAIFGTGPVGTALGSALAKGGHHVIFGTRSPDKRADERTYRDAAAEVGVIVFAVPFAAAESVLKSAGDLSGRILLDATNAVGMDDEGPMTDLPPGESAGERITRWASDALVYKTFNQVGLEVLGGADRFGGERPFMLIAGPDGDALRTVEGLVHDAGFDPQYLGTIRQAPLLEALAMIWIHLTGTKRAKRDWALIRRRMNES